MVEGGVGVDLEAAQALRRHRAVVQRWVVRVRPRRSVGVAVPVVVAEQVVLPDLIAVSIQRFSYDSVTDFKVEISKISQGRSMQPKMDSQDDMVLVNRRSIDLRVARDLEGLIYGAEEILYEWQNL